MRGGGIEYNIEREVGAKKYGVKEVYEIGKIV